MGLAPEQIRGYRGGYLPNLRREIEGGLRDGSVRVVVSTNALELGIDVGRLDVAVLVGYPGSQASFWQRCGRVGRRGGASLAVMIARSDPVDQYLARNPRYLFEGPRERLGLDPDNLVLLSEQLKCAAFELPFQAEEDGSVQGFGPAPEVPGILDYLAEESKILHYRDRTWYWIADAYPAQQVTLFGNEPDNVVILDADTDKALGEIDREGSLTACHEGAIYQVEGETWKIERFDYENRRAFARRVKSDYFTDAQTDTEVRVLRLEEKRARATPAAPSGEDWAVWRGEVHVTTLATQYKKVRFYTRENVGAEEINLPPEELDTEAFVLTLDEGVAGTLGLTVGNRASAWRAVGRLIRHVAPLFLRCRPGDLGLSTEVRSSHFGRPAIFLYDRVMGGVGLGQQLFAGHAEIAAAAHSVVRDCACELGCPACVGPVEEVGPLGKETAAAVLEHLTLAGELTPSELEPALEAGA
jgi:DEAD/DEAH box helicase domain-containing protein